MEGRLRELLRVRSTAAVNVGLTGSVDWVSPWQRSVDVDPSQKTLTNMATESNTAFFVVRPVFEPETKKKLGVCKTDARE